MASVKIDRVAPAFELPASAGGTIASWDFKARRPLVLFFPHADCAACRAFLRRLAQERARYEEHGAQVLALVPASLDACRKLAAELALPFPLLADTAGAVRARYNVPEGFVALVVLDRYGEPYGEWQASEADALAAAEALLAALRLPELECPECGVPDGS
jgi:peroxiredoxin